jgi:phospholipase A1
LAQKKIPAKDIETAIPPEKPIPQESVATVEKDTPPKLQEEEKYFSVMEKQWDMSLAPDKKKNIFVLWPYRPCFFLPAAYNSSPNRDTALEYDPDAKAQYNEVKFQLSFKFKIWKDLFRGELKDKIEESSGIRGIDVWVAYTQQSFWQLYNNAFSSPFRDTNYEPELLLNFRMQHDIPGLMGMKLQFINAGFNHQSNGRSEPLSRSWNRIVANVGLEKMFGAGGKDSFGLLLSTWYRLPENEDDDDNPDLSEYMGYSDLLGTLYWKNQRFALMLRNNLRAKNKGAVQVDWSFPLPLIGDKICGYIQYFNGYGEGLLDYNTSINRISAGFMIVDWK